MNEISTFSRLSTLPLNLAHDTPKIMSQNPPQHSNTTITDIDIPFGRLISIMLKLMLASIPAILILYAVIFSIMLVVMLIFGGGAAILSNFIDQGSSPESLPMDPSGN